MTGMFTISGDFCIGLGTFGGETAVITVLGA